MSLFSRFLEWLRGTPPSDDPDAFDSFRLQLEAMVRTVDPTLTWDAGKRAFVSPDGAWSFIGNHWDRYRTAPEDEREGILLDTARIVVSFSKETPQLAEDWETAADHLLPRLRPRHMYEALRLDQLAGDRDPPSEPLATLRPLRGDLHVELAYDTPTTIQNIRGSRLAAWGVDEDAAYARALANLDRLTPADAFQRVRANTYTCSVGDCYDSTRMLLVDRIRALPLAGRPLALPANRDTLYIVGEDDPEAVGLLLKTAAKAMDLPRLDTVAPLVLTEDGWRGWVPPPDHPDHAEWKELAIRDLGQAYAAAKSGLEKVHEADLTDVFVASFSALARDDVPFSYAILAPIDMWLPQTELLSVMDESDGTPVIVSRAEVDRLAGDRMTPVPDVFPAYVAIDADLAPWLLEQLARAEPG